MRESRPLAPTARFAGFELDLDSGELHRSGFRIHLGEQPTQVLLALVRAGGRLVTRDELRAALWPPDTFVEDADQGLNAAVKRLRDALGDTADEPRFIETVPRRGYRFVGVLDAPPASAPLPPAAPATGPSPRRPRRAVLALFALALGAVGTVTLLWPAGTPRVTSIRPLAAHLEAVGSGPLDTWSWATDGARVYLAIARKGKQQSGAFALFQMPATGGELEEIPLPCPYLTTVLGYVKSESALLVQGLTTAPGVEENPEARPLWLVPVPSATPRRVPNVAGYVAAVSKDGATIAAVVTRTVGSASGLRQPRLLTARLDGSRLSDRGELPPLTFALRWAPDGRRLRARVSTSGGAPADESIWDVPLDGTSSRRLWHGLEGDWTTDGRYYVFERADPSSGRLDLFAHREPWRWWLPRAPRQLTVGPVSFLKPGSSADSRAILAYGLDRRAELMRYEPSTRTYVPALGGESATEAEPSPDGQWLVWVRYPEGSLWRSRIDGTDRLMLAGPPLEVHMPRWSPDGRQVAFVARSPEAPSTALYVAAADGSSREVVVKPQLDTDQFWNPCYLPDGTILFSTQAWRNPPGIRQVDPRTRRVTLMPGTEQLRWPVTSRLGDVQAVGGELASLRMFVRRRGTDQWRDVGPSNLTYPRWTRDGRALCGASSPAPFACIDVDTGRYTPFEVQPPFPLLAWKYAIWVGLDADDRPLVTADRSTIGFYALDWDAP